MAPILYLLFYLSSGHIHVGMHFYVTYHSIHIFQSYLSHYLYRLKFIHPVFFSESRNPRLYWSIATLATTFFFRMGYQMLFWSRHTTCISSLPTSCTPAPSNLVANNHSYPFLFSESPISLPPITGIYFFFSRFLYCLLSSGLVNVTPSLHPPSIYGPD